MAAVDCLVPFTNVCDAAGVPVAGWFNTTTNAVTFVDAAGNPYAGVIAACCCDGGGGGTDTPNTGLTAQLVGDDIVITVTDSAGTLTDQFQIVSADDCNSLEVRADGLFAKDRSVAHPQWTYIGENDVCPRLVSSVDIECVDPWRAKYDGLVTCFRVWLPVNETVTTATLTGNTNYEGTASWRLETSTDNLVYTNFGASFLGLNPGVQFFDRILADPIAADTFLAPQLLNIGSPGPVAPILQATVIYDICD